MSSSEEISSMCEKIIRDLEDIFSMQNDIIEISYVLSDEQSNKSPILYEENCVGIESWCIPHLFKHIYLQLFPRPCPSNRPQDSGDLERYTRILLLLQPDITTLWNIRRELFRKDVLKFDDELKLSELILQLKPKSASTFNYREWLYLNADPQAITNDIIQHELNLTLKCSEKYDRNYYAWSHRAWIFQVLLRKADSPVLNDEELLYEKINNDLQTTQHYLEHNISDYSCCHYRNVLLSKISLFSVRFEERYWNLLMKENEFIDEMLKLYPDKECFNLHRRAVLSFIHRFNPANKDLGDKVGRFLHTADGSNFIDIF